MNSVCFTASNLGSLAGFVVALYADYRMQAVYALIVPILFLFVFYFVPETPAFLQKSGQNQVNHEFYKFC